MDELVTWLRAQLDEDERSVAAILRREPEWLVDAEPWEAGGIGIITRGNNSIAVALGDYAAKHIAYWDPARVLAEVDAKRQMLGLHAPVTVEAGWPLAEHARCEYCAGLCHSRSGISCEQPTDAEYPCDTVRILALPYADRPGYREEWRP